MGTHHRLSFSRLPLFSVPFALSSVSPACLKIALESRCHLVWRSYVCLRCLPRSQSTSFPFMKHIRQPPLFVACLLLIFILLFHKAHGIVVTHANGTTVQIYSLYSTIGSLLGIYKNTLPLAL
jgi:hypothetical protein